MKHFITYNRNDYVIWGIGTSEDESFNDANKNIKRFTNNHVRIGRKAESDNNLMELATVEATENLFKHIEKEGYYNELNWKIINHNGQRKAYMLPDDEQVVSFFKNYRGTIIFIGQGKILINGEETIIDEAIAILRDRL